MFNAIKYTQELERVGLSRAQAEATVNMVHEFAELNLATKNDVAELKHEIEKLEYKMTIKFGAMQVATIGILVALLKLF
jgi:hypothetical protein